MLETKLYDDFGDMAAVSVNLNELLGFIKSKFPDIKASVHYDDYDEYGCEHYIKIKGSTANIFLKKNYGGMYCPADYLDCEVVERFFRNNETGINHEFYFKDGAKPKPVSIGENYAERIVAYIESHRKYLDGDKSIFRRVDYKWYDDLRGANKMNTISFDIINVSDDDFYVEFEQKTEYTNSEIAKPTEITYENPEDDFL